MMFLAILIAGTSLTNAMEGEATQKRTARKINEEKKRWPHQQRAENRKRTVQEAKQPEPYTTWGEIYAKLTADGQVIEKMMAEEKNQEEKVRTKVRGQAEYH